MHADCANKENKLFGYVKIIKKEIQSRRTKIFIQVTQFAFRRITYQYFQKLRLMLILKFKRLFLYTITSEV